MDEHTHGQQEPKFAKKVEISSRGNANNFALFYALKGLTNSFIVTLEDQTAVKMKAQGETFP